LTYNGVWFFYVSDSDNYFSGNVFWPPIRAGQCEGICFDNDRLIICNEKGDLFKLSIDEFLVKKGD
jgi:hypothetical protein